MKMFRFYRRRFSNYLIIIILLFFAGWGSIKVFSYSYHLSSSIIISNETRPEYTSSDEFTLTINPGASLTDIAQILYENNYIESKILFLSQGYFYDYYTKLQPGTYTLKNTYDNITILDTLTPVPKKITETIRLTIPEGYTVLDIAHKVESLGICSAQDFIDAANSDTYNFKFIEHIPKEIPYLLEGYLFPDTYFVTADMSASEIVHLMLKRFDEISNLYTHYLLDTPYTLHDIVTIASIVEGEARVANERPIIAGVIYNRLNTSMHLQMCSTVQYSLENRKSVLTYEDLEINSPYNTYLHQNLPIGPIASPGEDSLKAAFIPESHDYYFFVLKDTSTGEHAFSTTGSEHNAHKEKYQLENDVNFLNH